jgi:hypothetical protein
MHYYILDKQRLLSKKNWTNNVNLHKGNDIYQKKKVVKQKET